MSECKWCHKEMTNSAVVTCMGNTEVHFPDFQKLPAIPYQNEFVAAKDKKTHRCHDCYVTLGGFHHPGCGMERCPRCGGQLISCGCLDEPEDDDDYEDEYPDGEEIEVIVKLTLIQQPGQSIADAVALAMVDPEYHAAHGVVDWDIVKEPA